MNDRYGIALGSRWGGRLAVYGLSLLVAVSSGSASEPSKALTEISNRSEVATFLDEITDNDYLESTVGDFRKVDLDSDGRPELLASVDYSGRGFFNTLLIVWEDEESTHVQKLQVWNLESLDGVVEDLDRNGRQELLTRQLLTPYLGARPYAAWTTVRSLKDGEYVESSSQFPDFYDSRILPALEETLERLPTTDDRRAEHMHMATEVERAKVLRELGRDSKSGLLSALQWADEPDPVGRIFAASIMKEIEDPAAEQALQRLAEDSDREVAMYAAVAIDLERQRRGEYKPR